MVEDRKLPGKGYTDVNAPLRYATSRRFATVNCTSLSATNVMD